MILQLLIGHKEEGEEKSREEGVGKKESRRQNVKANTKSKSFNVSWGGH